MIKEFKKFEAHIYPDDLFDNNTSLFSIPDKYDLTDEQHRSFDMLEKAYQIIGKFNKRWGGTLKVYSVDEKSKYTRLSLRQGVSGILMVWDLFPNGKIRKGIHRYQMKLGLPFYPKTVRQIINVLITDLDGRTIGLEQKLELLGANLPKKIKNIEVDPWGEEDWEDSNGKDNRMYWINLMNKIRFDKIKIDYID